MYNLNTTWHLTHITWLLINTYYWHQYCTLCSITLNIWL